jgi:hypothetical protein
MLVMSDSSRKPKIVLSDEEKKRLVAYFNVLIEMDFELKKSDKKEDEDGTLEAIRNRKS